MSLHAKMIITLVAVFNCLFVLEMLRKKKLTESYSLLWFLVIGVILFATWMERFLFYVTRLFGAVVPVSALTLLSLVFILVMLIFFSMKIAKMERKIKEMAQQVALANASTGNREGER
jgi:hypothetical protein